MSQPLTKVSEGDTEPRRATISDIPRIRVDAETAFEEILKAGKPAIIEGSNIGACVDKWTAAYLNETVGPQKKVSRYCITMIRLLD
jgi:tRNA wybutosine-synthesizing protein 4